MNPLIKNTNLAIFPDYGLDQEAYAPAQTMSNEKFVSVITGFDTTFDYSYPVVDYAPKSEFDYLSDSFDSAFAGSKAVVSETYQTLKSAAGEVIDTSLSFGSEIGDTLLGGVDNILIRVAVIFAIVVAGFYILAKTDLLKDVAKVLQAL